jgi:uncharacterized protein YndB with AHSA1/START domain
MDNEYEISKCIRINSSPPEVWDVLTNPDKISQYFSGAETISDWQAGSAILFHHEYEGEKFTNKGKILAIQPNHLLIYTYWTKYSQTEDLPENYTTMSYALDRLDNMTTLTFTQSNIKNRQWFEGLQTGWDTVLSKIKEIAEGEAIY